MLSINKFREFIKVGYSIIRELCKKVISPYIFTFIVISIWIIQLVYAEGWINQTIGNFSNFGNFTIILFIILIIDYIYNSHIASFRGIPEITPWDLILFSFLSISLVTLGIFTIRKLLFINCIIYIIIFIISLILMFCRIFKITKARIVHANQKQKSTLYELKDLEDPIPWKKADGLILINEKASSYDLLDRKNVELLLKNTISKYSVAHSTVVGLIGEWGAGKTTLLNLVKKDLKKEDFVFANQDFDVWLFGSQEALIKGLYDFILNGLGIRYNSIVNDKFLESIAHVVAGIPKAGNLLSSLLTDRSYKDVMTLKEKLSKYIQSSNKHYVICIENLDRASDKQVILLLKLISTVFDLPNVTYVLLYSESRMNQILKENNDINQSYLDKVVNFEVKMPLEFNRKKCIVWLRNVLLSYGVSQQDLKQYDFVLNFIAYDLKDIRDLKRIINSVFSFMIISDTLRLNLPQLLAIQYIYYSNSELYEEIKTHQEMFIFEDTYGPYSKKELNDEENKYFTNLDKKYSNYVSLLMNLFPKFKKHNSCIMNYNETENSLKNVSISTQRYFKAYFYLIENSYVDINYRVRHFVEDINSGKDINLVWSNFLDKRDHQSEDLLTELYLFLKVDDIPSYQDRATLSEVLFNSLVDKNNQLTLDNLQITYIIGKLIGEVDEDQFLKFENMICHHYEALEIVRLITELLEETWGGISKNLSRNRHEMSKIYDKMRKEIFDKKINLFQDKYYSWRNATGMYDYFNENNIPASKYLNKIASKDNVYRILFDCIIIGYNGKGKETYRFDMNNLRKYIDFDNVPRLKETLNGISENNTNNTDRKKVQEVLLIAAQQEKSNQSEKSKLTTHYDDNPISPNKL